jgi:hypothetical protein
LHFRPRFGHKSLNAPLASAADALFHSFDSNAGFKQLVDERVLERVRELDERGRARGLKGMKPQSDVLVRIGTERDDEGKVSKNGYGVLHLPWLAQQHPEWPEMIRREAAEIRATIREAHGVGLKYVIWAGMGGSAEDKAFNRRQGC